jgi:hypothetical protein
MFGGDGRVVLAKGGERESRSSDSVAGLSREAGEERHGSVVGGEAATGNAGGGGDRSVSGRAGTSHHAPQFLKALLGGSSECEAVGSAASRKEGSHEGGRVEDGLLERVHCLDGDCKGSG